MFSSGIGFFEMVVIALIALVIVGPKELPKMMKTIFKLIGRGRAMISDMQRSLNDAVKDTEFDEVKKMAQDMRNFKSDGYKSYLDPDKKIEKDLKGFTKELQEQDSSLRKSTRATSSANKSESSNANAQSSDAPAATAAAAVKKHNPLLSEAEAYSRKLDAQKN